jgi:hypothetical protein
MAWGQTGESGEIGKQRRDPAPFLLAWRLGFLDRSADLGLEESGVRV